ncbi:MAG: galactokinase, partial [Clostridia bacterium]|nr:galactokinase [Clostridia bacterium]
ELFFIPVTKQESALIGQFAENRFVGVNCGIMDQFASLMGRKDSALLLDTNTLDYRYYPLGDVSLVIVNSGVKHSLASSAYNQRRKECESASGDLGISSLCSLSPEKFEIKKNMIKDDVCRRRAKHAVYENSRTLEAASALENGDIKEFGRLMKMSHISLKDDYEVSCKELDFLAESAWQIKGVYGARMTGGGFGGCTVNLVRQSVSEEFISVISSEYEEHFGIIPEIYKVKGSDGAGVIIS